MKHPKPSGREIRIRSFTNEQTARAWMNKTLHDEKEFCIDKERFAFLDDEAGMAAYTEVRKKGCCGFMDEEVLVGGRRATIGCNYGH